MTVEVITTYLPIFREKLGKLERRGKGETNEAARLRRTIAKVESIQTRRPAARSAA